MTDTMDNFYCQLNIVRNNQGRGNTGSKPLSVSVRTFAERINLGGMIYPEGTRQQVPG